ncbi:MAG: Ppx/GppA phosphatase family protein [Pseudomonadota bacterium]
MSERSGHVVGQESESTQPERNDRKFGKHRRNRRRRRPSEGKAQGDQPGTVDPVDAGFRNDRKHDSESARKLSTDVNEGSLAPDAGADDAGIDADGTRQKNGKKHRFRKGKARNNEDENSPNIRSLRSPPKRTPRPSYTPVEEHKHNGSAEVHGHKRKHFRKQAAYAALDLGTNNCRLLIAVPRQRGRFRVVDGFSRIVRLGEGLSQTGKLGEAAMDRAIEALKICAAKLENRDLKQHRLIATEACRQAENGSHFLQRVREETGLELEIVTRQTEARLAAAGCGSLMDHKSDAAVMFDIGGGSTELILVKGNRRRREKITDRIEAWTSLPMGVVTLAERFGGKDVTPEIFSNMVDCVIEEISKFEGKDKLDHIFQAGRAHLLGTSGTVTTLAGIHLKLERYDRRKVDGLWMKSHEINKVIHDLIAMNYKQRANNPCIGRERADLVLAGCAILEAIRIVWPANRLRVADRGLREGLLAEMMSSDRAWRSPRRPRRNAQRFPRGN